jgi:formylglycine-generating enzyme required for sulfatase activity
VDDDCDGALDEDSPGVMVHVVAGGLDFFIDAYEASRPNATASDAGTMSHVACSEPNRLPWANVTWDQAAAACVAAGKRLCSEMEWQAACAGPSALLYPYGDLYDPMACNGDDYDPDCTDPDDDLVQPTGSPYGCPPPSTSECVSDAGAYDLSGNLMEWTASQVNTSPDTYRIRGGSYFNIDAALTCDFDFISAETTFAYDDLGFRCCSDTFPP